MSILRAVRADDLQTVKRLLKQHHEELHHDHGTGSWLHNAARKGSLQVATFLIERGLDVNAEIDNSSRDTPLFCAIAKDSPAMVKLLLENGADINKGRPVITAITGSNKHSLELVKLLEKHGADLHKLYPYGDGKPINALSMAIAWGKDDVAEYLRSKGAVMPEERMPSKEPESLDDEIIAYFNKHFGPVQRQAVIEILPTEPSIAVHVVPAPDDRDHITLFTTGMSSQMMNVPDGQADFQFAELFIQLPRDWKYMEFGDPNFGWPVHWLRQIAQETLQSGTWLGGPVTIFGNGDPPQPLAPNTRFVSMLLLAQHQMVSRDDRTIQLYRLTPLYAEESELEQQDGVPALMRAFDNHNVPFIVDLHRLNVAKQH